MMPTRKLIDAVTGVDWSENVKNFVDDPMVIDKMAKASLRLATWARQFESIDQSNPALSFIREMQVCVQLVAVNASLAIYKSAASAIRSMVETALYYTYFRVHPVELATLANNPKYFVAKNEVLDFHNMHTPDFAKLQAKIGLISKLNPWYSSMSAIVHGQIPGRWSNHISISQMKFDENLRDSVIDAFCEAEDLIHKLFLCTCGRDIWEYMSVTAKRGLLAGISGDIKKEFGLDSA